jgi:hypothetical protein
MADKLSAEALRYHIARRTSVALVTLHLSGFRAGRKGHGPSQNPFPDGGIHAFEWEAARAAGASSLPLGEGSE